MAYSSERVHLTKTAVEKIKPPTTGKVVVWDDKLSGFAVRVTPPTSNGRITRTYFFQYRSKTGKQGSVKIGRHGDITADKARAIAKGLAAAVAERRDPAQEIREGREAEKERIAAPTVADMLDAYIQIAIKKGRRETTLDGYQRNINIHLKPALGDKKVAELTDEEIEAFHASMSERPYQANRCLALLSAAFNRVALKRKWRPDKTNPCAYIERNKEYFRPTYLKPKQIERLLEAMDESKSPAVDALKLALFSGCRISEALRAEWSQFDLDEGIWSKPASSTKQKTPHVVPLGPAALALLNEMKAKAKTDYLFPGMRSNTPQRHYRHAWNRITKKAGLPGFRVHDMRHHFVSEAKSQGLSDSEAGSLVGHSNPATTAKYGRVKLERQKVHIDQINAAIMGKEDDADALKAQLAELERQQAEIKRRLAEKKEAEENNVVPLQTVDQR